MRTFLFLLVMNFLSRPVAGLANPPKSPDAARGGFVSADRVYLENGQIRCVWQNDGSRIGQLAITNLHTDQVLQLTKGFLPTIRLGEDTAVDLAKLNISRPLRLENLPPKPAGVPEQTRHQGCRLTADFQDAATGLQLIWSAELRDGANYIVQSLQLTATEDTTIQGTGLCRRADRRRETSRASRRFGRRVRRRLPGRRTPAGEEHRRPGTHTCAARCRAATC